MLLLVSVDSLIILFVDSYKSEPLKLPLLAVDVYIHAYMYKTATSSNFFYFFSENGQTYTPIR